MVGIVTLNAMEKRSMKLTFLGCKEPSKVHSTWINADFLEMEFEIDGEMDFLEYN
jgi:hypothetical protein